MTREEAEALLRPEVAARGWPLRDVAVRKTRMGWEIHSNPDHAEQQLYLAVHEGQVINRGENRWFFYPQPPWWERVLGERAFPAEWVVRWETPRELDWARLYPLQAALNDCSWLLAKRLLDEGVDPNTKDPDGYPLLSLVIDIEADAYAQTGFTDTYCPLGDPLFPAGNIVRWFLEAGADPNALDPEGKAPLDWAVHNFGNELLLYHPGAAKLLVAAGGRCRKIDYP